jgi:hypothetical protein
MSNIHICLYSYSRFPQVSTGGILAVFKPVERPAFPTPERVIESVAAFNISVLFAIPSFLEASMISFGLWMTCELMSHYIKAWAQNPAHIEPLKKCRAVVCVT